VKRRKNFSECQHRGFGKHCHRCAQADLLLRASKGHAPVPFGTRSDWSVQDMADESLRLYGPSKPEKTS